MAEMKEHPILYTPGNVRAILDGRKTQTRRIVKLPKAPNNLGSWEETIWGGVGCTMKGTPVHAEVAIWHTRTGTVVTCPYGHVGDRLWVKEGLERHGSICRYRRDREVIAPARCWEWQRNTLSPRHMPKWAARLWLEITEVRVQRLQDCSENDAIAEGVEYFYAGLFRDYIQPGDVGIDGAIGSYQSLWESINGPGSWEQNPWVWAITFKRIFA